MTLTIESAAAVFVGTSVPGWKGWRLTVDGSAAPICTFNHAFLGFQAPPGRHRAVLRYRPDGFVAGAAITAATAATLLFLGLRRGGRRGPEPARVAPASGPSPPTT